MKLSYSPTSLESWLSHFYRKLGIKTPDELEEQRIARSLGIHLFYKEIPSMAYEIDRFKSITIDKRLPSLIQREHFYHELCHILCHSGRQLMMPAAFRELQEWDARNFSRYAALPLHMLKNYDYKQPEILKVTLQLCSARLLRIKSRLSCTPIRFISYQIKRTIQK